jgi:hypothetical protein
MVVPRNVANAIEAGVKSVAMLAFVTIVIKYAWSVLKRKVWMQYVLVMTLIATIFFVKTAEWIWTQSIKQELDEEPAPAHIVSLFYSLKSLLHPTLRWKVEDIQSSCSWDCSVFCVICTRCIRKGKLFGAFLGWEPPKRFNITKLLLTLRITHRVR